MRAGWALYRTGTRGHTLGQPENCGTHFWGRGQSDHLLKITEPLPCTHYRGEETGRGATWHTEDHGGAKFPPRMVGSGHSY